MEYEIEEDPFIIELKAVHKKAIKAQKLLILPKSRSLAILYDGTLAFAEYTTDLKTVPLTRKGITTIARSRHSLHNTDLVAVGFKKGLMILSVSAYEVIESEIIPFSAIPTQIEFITEKKMVVCTKSAVYLVDSEAKSSTEIFRMEDQPLFSTKNDSFFACVLETPSIQVDANAGQIISVEKKTVFFSNSLEFYKVDLSTKEQTLLFSWPEIPLGVLVDDYYAVGLISNTIHVRSLKTGFLLQSFTLPHCTTLIYGDTVYAFSGFCVWRLLPLDFDDQIDELLVSNRFKDAQTLIDELDFADEKDRNSNIVKVKGVYSQYLFNVEKNYEEALKVLESLNASPMDVVELYPDIMDEKDGPCSEHSALFHLGQYLARERSRLLIYIKDLSSQIVKWNESLTSFKSISALEEIELTLNDSRNILEFTETALLQVYLISNNPLLGPLLRMQTSCNYERTVALLLKYKVFKV
jgi:hypothetical protein